MKLFISVLMFLSCCFFSCKKSTEPLVNRTWGEETNGLKISLYNFSSIISQGKNNKIDLIVRNVSRSRIEKEILALLILIDDSSGCVKGYNTTFNLMAENIDEIYESSKGHPRTNLVLNPDEQIKFRIDIIELGWIHNYDSRTPSEQFFDLIEKSKYKLYCLLEFIKDENAFSNTAIVDVK